MFIGEAPGKDEDLAGEPFAGKGLNQAGAILDQRLEAIGLLRPEIYVSNVVKCRPTKVGKGDSPKNRAPEEGEIRACRPWIEEEVMFVQPQLVVPLGVPAAEYVLGDRVLMKDVHGQVLQGEGSTWSGRKIVPTYHPAGIRGSEELRQMFADDFETIRRVYKDIVAGLASSG
jgi:DNA polymerase